MKKLLILLGKIFFFHSFFHFLFLFFLFNKKNIKNHTYSTIFGSILRRFSRPSLNQQTVNTIQSELKENEHCHDGNGDHNDGYVEHQHNNDDHDNDHNHSTDIGDIILFFILFYHIILLKYMHISMLLLLLKMLN